MTDNVLEKIHKQLLTTLRDLTTAAQTSTNNNYLNQALQTVREIEFECSVILQDIDFVRGVKAAQHDAERIGGSMETEVGED